LEAQNHPHILERKNFINLDGVTQPAPAPRFSETHTSMPNPAPKIGQDNNEILLNLGYNNEDINNFLNTGIIK
jgi:alpha-methylacyl-CoA racemase